MYTVGWSNIPFNMETYNAFFLMFVSDNNNRVKLLSEPGMPGSDFINASFVSVRAVGMHPHITICDLHTAAERSSDICVLLSGLSVSQWVHSHAGSTAQYSRRLLEDDLGDGDQNHRHAHTVLREGPGMFGLYGFLGIYLKRCLCHGDFVFGIKNVWLK